MNAPRDPFDPAPAAANDPAVHDHLPHDLRDLARDLDALASADQREPDAAFEDRLLAASLPALRDGSPTVVATIGRRSAQPRLAPHLAPRLLAAAAALALVAGATFLALRGPRSTNPSDTGATLVQSTDTTHEASAKLDQLAAALAFDEGSFASEYSAITSEADRMTKSLSSPFTETESLGS